MSTDEAEYFKTRDELTRLIKERDAAYKAATVGVAEARNAMLTAFERSKGLVRDQTMLNVFNFGRGTTMPALFRRCVNGYNPEPSLVVSKLKKDGTPAKSESVYSWKNVVKVTGEGVER